MLYPNSEKTICPECGSPAAIINYSGSKDSGYQIKYRCSNTNCERNVDPKKCFLSENFKKETLPDIEYEFIFKKPKTKKA